MKCDRKREGKECGGEIDLVTSSDGKTEWGGQCRTCRKFLSKCQGCGEFFKSLGSHIEGKKREGRLECYAANLAYRTAVAAKQLGQVEP